MKSKRTDDATLISSLRILARDTVSNDGVASATIAEAADRIEELAPQPTPLKWRKTQYAGELICIAAGFEYYAADLGNWEVVVRDAPGYEITVATGTEKTLEKAKAKCQKHFDKHVKDVLKACGVRR